MKQSVFAKILALALVCVMIACTFTACGKKAADAGAAGAGKDTLTIAVEGTISNLDAKEGVVNQSANVYSVVGESLLKQVNNDKGLPEMSTEGSITESFEIDAENSGIIYHLKQNVAMHDGTTLDADDVVCSVMHMQNGTYYADVNYEKVYAIDKQTVFIGVTTVGQPVINKVSTIPIFSKEAYEKANNDGLFFTEAYVSCGQFKISQWVSGDSVTVEAFGDYFGGAPKLSKVIFRIFSETSVAMMELQSGGVDVIMNPDYLSYEDVMAGKYESLSASSATGNMLFSIYFNMNSPKLQDFKVRQAIMLCLDRSAISQGTFNGSGTLSYRILGATYAGMTTYDAASWPYQKNVEQAKKLMAEAGFADGMELNLISHNANTFYSTMGEVFANQVKEIGITVNISIYEPATFKSTQNGLEGWDVSTTSPNTSYVTNASDFLNNALIGSMHCDAVPTAGYEDALALCTALKTETDETKVAALCKQFEETYFNEWLWWVPVQLSGVYTLYNASLVGFERCQAVLDLSQASFQ